MRLRHVPRRACCQGPVRAQGTAATVQVGGATGDDVVRRPGAAGGVRGLGEADRADGLSEGTPAGVSCANSHQENVSGNTAVPRLAESQPTVAVADTVVDSNPTTGGNQWSLRVPPVTVTLSESLLSTGWPACPRWR